MVEPDRDNDMNYFFLIDGQRCSERFLFPLLANNRTGDDTPGGVVPRNPSSSEATENLTQSLCKDGSEVVGSKRGPSIRCALEEATQLEGEWVPADWLGYSNGTRIAAYPVCIY